MIGRMGSFARPSADLSDPLDLYLHGYVSSRLMNVSRSAPSSSSSSSSSDGQGPPPAGLPVTIAASHVDGLVLALTPNHHSYNYRSAVLFGHAEVVADPAEKLWAMELVTDGVIPHRWAATRVPPNPAEMQSTSMLRVRIAAGSAKIRTGGPREDRDDLADPALIASTWTGVVPVYQTLGEPVPGRLNGVAAVPRDLREWVKESNEDARAMAVEAVTKEPPPAKKEEGEGEE